MGLALEGLEHAPLPLSIITNPQGEDLFMADGVFIKRYRLKANELARQHVHKHSHATIVGRGKLRAWKNKKVLGDFEAGNIITIEAGAEHAFYAFEDSDFYCVHNEARALEMS